MDKEALLNELFVLIKDASPDRDTESQNVIKFIENEGLNVEDLEISQIRSRNFLIIDAVATCYFELKNYPKCLLLENKLIDFYLLNREFSNEDFDVFIRVSFFTKGRCYGYLDKYLLEYKTYLEFFRLNPISELIDLNSKILERYFFKHYIAPFYFMLVGAHFVIYIIRDFFDYRILNSPIMIVSAILLLGVLWPGIIYNDKLLASFRNFIVSKIWHRTSR